jgi:hypothetical protein
MAYSGTINKTKVKVAELIEFAFREAGKTAEEQTPEYIKAAKQALFYILQSLTNKGVDLWSVKTYLLGALQAQTVLDLPEGTVEILAANWRYLQTPNVSGTLPITNPDVGTLFNGNNQNLLLHATTTEEDNYFGWTYTSGQIITQVGFNAYAPLGTAIYNLVYETSADGITWTTREVLPTLELKDNEWYYFQIDPTPSHVYYRLRDTVATTFSLRSIQPSVVQQDIPLAKLNRDTYFALPNKQFQSQRSLQYWYNKGVTQQIYLWPIPQDNFQCFQIVTETQFQDVGTLTNELYVPNRWLSAIQSMLSHKVALQLPGVDLQRIQYLESQANINLTDAGNGEEDGAPIYFQPNISPYTR